MEQLLQNVLGGNQQDRAAYSNFAGQYEKGHPAEGYSDDEVMNRYQRVAQHAPPDVYRQAAEKAFARLSPQERQQFIQEVQHHAQQHNTQIPNLEGSANNPGQFAQAFTQMHEQQPSLLQGILGNLMGGGGTGGSASKGLMAGIATMAVKEMMANA